MSIEVNSIVKLCQPENGHGIRVLDPTKYGFKITSISRACLEFNHCRKRLTLYYILNNHVIYLTYSEIS